MDKNPLSSLKKLQQQLKSEQAEAEAKAKAEANRKLAAEKKAKEDKLFNFMIGLPILS